MLPEPQFPLASGQTDQGSTRIIAPAWHTVLLLFLLLGASLGGAHGIHPVGNRGKIPLYLWTIGWQWLLTGFVYLGVRRRISLRELIGRPWEHPEDFIRDLGIAMLFWLFAMAVLAVGGHLLHLDEGSQLDTMRRQLGFLVPGTTSELMVWFCVCITAGVCEEIIFRGYLQRQFAGITRSVFAGIVLSAIVFGAGHGYEGGPRMLLLGIYGFLFGALAWWRKNLRPGMMAHAWHDALAGVVLHLLK